MFLPKVLGLLQTNPPVIPTWTLLAFSRGDSIQSELFPWREYAIKTGRQPDLPAMTTLTKGSLLLEPALPEAQIVTAPACPILPTFKHRSQRARV